MSVDQTNIVDFISINSSGNVVLTISDHLEWDNEGRHIYILQEKLNKYLAFIESGEILTQYPEAKNRPVIISIVALNQPGILGKEFLTRARSIIEDSGIGFHFEQRHFNSP
jgi:hypothetical protein